MFPFYYLESCTSTNDEILNFLQTKSENCAVYTFHQTKGRGQYGNVWEAPKNLNLAYSFALKSQLVTIPPSLFNFYTAVVLRDFLANLTNHEIKIKWPNDIIIHQKKISGMIIEKQKIGKEDFYVIGIGINVLQEEFPRLPKAGSVFTQTQQKYNLEDFATRFHAFFSEKIKIMPEKSDVLEQFNLHLFRKNEISVFEIKNTRQNGIIKYADEDGFLWVELEHDGLQKFYHKQIELLY